MGRKERQSMIAATLGMLAASGGLESVGFHDSSTARKPREKEFTHFDQERLDNAQAKRDRKAAKRQSIT